MKIADNNTFRIYVYANDHNPPHCHLKSNDGDERVVTIPDLKVIIGKPLNKRMKEFLIENLNDLLEKWEEYRDL